MIYIIVGVVLVTVAWLHGYCVGTFVTAFRLFRDAEDAGEL